MIRKYHNHKLQTTPWHREEEPLNHHETYIFTVRKSLVRIHTISPDKPRSLYSPDRTFQL